MGPQSYINAIRLVPMYFGAMNLSLNTFISAAFYSLMGTAALAQDCPGGQSPFTLQLYTDAWGYEVYWEMTPEGDPCGTNTLYWGGNASGVGCDGEGSADAPAGNYASNATFILDTLCATPGEAITLHHVDSYGDGGTYFEVFAGGVLTHSFPGTGDGNVWTFDPFMSNGPDYDSPCAALDIEVDGPLVLLHNDSCTAAYAEPGAPTFDGVYSCQINGGWCEGGVTGSAWLSFVATSENCWITSCTDSTDFDTQMALWKVDDCQDFDTYELVAANDDLPGGCDNGAFYASGLWTGCLNAGETYWIQIDGWQNARGQAGVRIESVADQPTVTSSVGGLDCASDKEEDPNGTIVLNISGTGSNYSVAWIGPNNFSAGEQQISGLGGGTYSAAILTSCGNSLTHSVTLTEPDPLALSLELVQPGCPELPNGEAFLEVSGGTAPYDIQWLDVFGELGSGNMIDGLPEGQFSVQLEDDNGCEAALDFSLTAEDDAFAFTLGPDTTLCEDGQLVLSAPAGLEYLWSNGSVDQFIVVNASELGPGTYPYTVEASNAFGCSHADAIFITVFDCTMSTEDLDATALTVAPNPAMDDMGWEVRTTGSLQTQGWVLRDALGRVVQAGRWSNPGSGALRIPAGQLAKGAYTLQLEEASEVLRLLKH